MLVKICGLVTEVHVQAAVDAGADALGFVFADSVRRITPATAAAITENMPESVRKVAVMLHPTNREWHQVLHSFTPDVLQADAEDYSELDVPDTIECWPVLREGNKVTDTFRLGLKVTVPFLYEGAKSGAGETVDWATATEFARQGDMILAGGLNADNVADAIATVRPYGVDVSSAVESAPGVKDPDLIGKFVSAARAAEKNP